ncbi:thioredoxin-like domain-containing protein [Agriterribacter sp.]|uniref:TlpA family protein disulfide reductase n=1 Tax=Agriterribacter sp. TaxID=2821509 RepID=UPI002D195D53|nr:thioredoxin-like domain-containing protein [Agriterribacter sp.]HRO45039.1 redoxin domain-containing protein [Agriterribacter sp.]HRQ15520.1 redoxin domain-containing protein [Agriterribacter sp.]
MRYLFILLVLCVCNKQSTAQHDTAKTAPLYTQYPLPQFSILLTDSVTWYTKNDLPRKKKTVIMLFSPDCEHCKHETELIKKNISQFSGTQIVMVTPMPFAKMQEFYEHFELHKFKNITVGRDPKFFFSNYFKVHYLPFFAIYDKNYKLLKTFEGSTKLEDLVKYL